MRVRFLLSGLSFACMSPLALAAMAQPEGITIGNAVFELRLGTDATVRSLRLKASGEELLDCSDAVPFCSVTQERPYVNEIKLSFPNKRTEYMATRLRREGDRLVVGFEHGQYEAVIVVEETPDYVSLSLVDFLVPTNSPYRKLCMDFPPVEEMRIARLPVRRRRNFGDWLGVMWDDRAAVAVVATSPECLIDHVPCRAGDGCRSDQVC